MKSSLLCEEEDDPNPGKRKRFENKRQKYRELENVKMSQAGGVLNWPSN